MSVNFFTNVEVKVICDTLCDHLQKMKKKTEQENTVINRYAPKLVPNFSSLR